MTTFVDILIDVGFAKSRGEARRLIRGGAVSYLDGDDVWCLVTDENETAPEWLIEEDGGITVRAGKKRIMTYNLPLSVSELEANKLYNIPFHVEDGKTYVRDGDKLREISEPPKRRKDLKFQTVSPEWQESVEERLKKLEKAEQDRQDSHRNR